MLQKFPAAQVSPVTLCQHHFSGGSTAADRAWHRTGTVLSGHAAALTRLPWERGFGGLRQLPPPAVSSPRGDPSLSLPPTQRLTSAVHPPDPSYHTEGRQSHRVVDEPQSFLKNDHDV